MEKTMNYIDAMDFLEETKKYGSQLGLTSIQNLMAELGNIQDKIPLVHIGGTNGKGSVGAMLSQVLTEAGYRVGRFCTPDVFVYEDEFQPFPVTRTISPPAPLSAPPAILPLTSWILLLRMVTFVSSPPSRFSTTRPDNSLLLCL